QQGASAWSERCCALTGISGIADHRRSRGAGISGSDLDGGHCAGRGTGAVRRRTGDRLNDAINKALTSEAFKEKFAKIGDEPGGGTPKEFAATIKADSAKWSDVVQRSGAKLD